MKFYFYYQSIIIYHGINNIITSIHLTCDRGEVLEIDTWVGASGKNGMRRDWLIRSQATGQIFARATRYCIHIYYLCPFLLVPSVRAERYS